MNRTGDDRGRDRWEARDLLVIADGNSHALDVHDVSEMAELSADAAV